MPDNYILLEKITVGAAGASSVVFSNIPQTGYTDLIIKGSVRTTQAATYGLLSIRPNGSTANISGIRMYAGDGNVYSDNTPSLALISGDATGANTFGSFETYIANYASSSFKTFTSQSTGERNQTNDTYMGTSAILWSDTTAITSLEIMPNAVGFISGCTFYLYGVAKLGSTPAIAPMATGGDIIETDGTYWYHAFLSSGTFTPARGLSCDVLVVAGGGGGGGTQANDKGSAGGGAGGIIYFASSSVSTAQTVTVGAGGAGGPDSGNMYGANGVSSQFASLPVGLGGGGGGAGYGGAGPSVQHNGYDGGSGGGSTRLGIAGLTTQSSGGTAYYGNNGGAAGAADGGSGGGGAGAVGTGASAATGANGGAGINIYSTWLNTTGTGVSGFIAGGGGGGAYSGSGGTGGSGGGGNGGASGGGQGTAGTANTGGGGGGTSGGSSPARTGNAGGSGIVIVRYAV